MNTCATCQWMQPYAPGKPDEGGECMVDPPIVAVVRDGVVTLRPHVTATDRCSAWDDGKPATWFKVAGPIDLVEEDGEAWDSAIRKES